ncbi:MAG TPA: helix-turn-helix transcriptional regulator [Nitrospiraceae bacterium]|jgi:transcriptional regulator with XRE-family HTH domain|nr:helix-turn-helix transcriptional regulator [Nitrospiraceae bacterium]
MDTNKMIESRRLKLGLSESQIAKTIGISLDSYCDIESHVDELCTVVELRRIKQLSQILGIETFELLSIHCSFCNADVGYLEEYHLPRNELIKVTRQKAGLSQQQLGDRSDFHDYAIEGMERDPGYLDRSTVESVLELANALKIPFQILSGLKCQKCGR